MLWFPSSHSIPSDSSPLPSQVSDEGGPLLSFASASATLPPRSHSYFTPPPPQQQPPLHWTTSSSSTESAGSAASLGFPSRERVQSATAFVVGRKTKNDEEEKMASHPPPSPSAAFPLTIPAAHTGTVATTSPALPPCTSPAMADYERREWELLMEGILEEQVRCESTVLAWMARAEALESEVRELRAAAAEAKEEKEKIIPPPPPPLIEDLLPPSSSLTPAEEAQEALWWMEAAVEEQIKVLRQEKKNAMDERDASRLAHTRLLDALQRFGQWWWGEAVEAGMAGPIPTRGRGGGGGHGGIPARLAAASSSSSAAAAREGVESLARCYGIRTPSTPSRAVASTTTTPFRARNVNTSGWGSSGKGREKGGIPPLPSSSSSKRHTKKVPSQHRLPKEEEEAEEEEKAERVDVWDRLYHHLFSARRLARQAIASPSSLVWSSPPPPRDLAFSSSSTFSLSAAQWHNGTTTNTPPRDAPHPQHRHAFETLSRKAPPPPQENEEKEEDKDEEDVAYGTHLLFLLQRACRCGFEGHRHLSTAMSSRA